MTCNDNNFSKLSHSIINPITEKNKDLISKHNKGYEKLKKYKLYYSGYNDLKEFVNEHIIRYI
ncbi:DUF4932 domain-containing protein [Paraclostridium sordellii]|uniref:DUF4932 domain-containing protein n=1 Tax=Paraclostridium sordellii TaxID=1505 RepID=UPI0034DD1651